MDQIVAQSLTEYGKIVELKRQAATALNIAALPVQEIGGKTMYAAATTRGNAANEI